MCIIVDNNVASLVLVSPDPAYQPIYDALFKNRTAKAVHGGKLTDEYGPNVKARLKLLDQIGGVRVLSEPKVREKTAELETAGKCSSDDPHVLAVAWISGARLLCSDDDNLTADFKNPHMLPKPRGNVCHSSKKVGASARVEDAEALLRKHCGGASASGTHRRRLAKTPANRR